MRLYVPFQSVDFDGRHVTRGKCLNNCPFKLLTAFSQVVDSPSCWFFPPATMTMSHVPGAITRDYTRSRSTFPAQTRLSNRLKTFFSYNEKVIYHRSTNSSYILVGKKLSFTSLMTHYLQISPLIKYKIQYILLFFCKHTISLWTHAVQTIWLLYNSFNISIES